MKDIALYVKMIWKARTGKSFKIPKGGAVVIFQDCKDLEKLSDATSDAEFYTGIKYCDLLTQQQTQLITNP